MTVFGGFLAFAVILAVAEGARAGELGLHLFELGFDFCQAIDVLVHLGQLGVEIGGRVAGLDGLDAGVVGLFVLFESGADLVDGIGDGLDARLIALFVELEGAGLGLEGGEVGGHHGRDDLLHGSILFRWRT